MSTYLQQRNENLFVLTEIDILGSYNVVVSMSRVYFSIFLKVFP